MPTESNIEILKGRQAARATLTDGHDDLSGEPVVASMQTQSGDSQSATLFIDTQGTVAVTVEFSPDGGETWYEPGDESPLAFDSAGSDLVHITYNASHIRLSADSSTGVRAALRVIA